MRHPAEQRQDQPCQGVVAAFGGQIGQVEAGFYLINRHQPIEQQGAFIVRRAARRGGGAVFGVADNRLQGVRRGDDAFEAAVFIEHQREAERV